MQFNFSSICAHHINVARIALEAGDIAKFESALDIAQDQIDNITNAKEWHACDREIQALLARV